MASEQQKKQKQQQWPLNFFLFVKQLIQKTKKKLSQKNVSRRFFFILERTKKRIFVESKR